MKRIFDKEKKIVIYVLAAVASVYLFASLEAGENSSGRKLPRLLGALASPPISTVAASPRQAAFVYLANKFRGAVVNISTTQLAEGAQEFQGPFGEADPFSDFWRRFFGDPSPGGTFRQESVGSGVIIDGEGYILTNHHVIENAEKIVIKLSDEREFNAKVIGTDSKTDIALIKIDAKEPLLTAPLGDSDQLEVGEWVLAIGNPFGLGNTVTAGIVSAKDRNIGVGPYDNFIQTNASINPGNSGGPLINMRGEVVGINTAIFSQSGENIGIGFATPINLAKEILPQLKSKGRVTRGWLGILIQRVTPEIAESLGLDKPRGGLVADVIKDGPADHGGIKVGDVITEFDGKEIKESGALPGIVSRTPVGKKISLKVLRDKKEVVHSVIIGEVKGEEKVAPSRENEELGLTVQKVTPQIAERLGLDTATGVVITAVAPGSPADDAGLERGDVILEIDHKPIRTVADYRKSIAEVEKRQGILFLVRRGKSALFLVLKPSQ